MNNQVSIHSDSDSTFQQDMEPELIKRLEKELKLSGLHNEENVKLNNYPKTSIKPDIYSEEHMIIGEVHVHSGKMRAAQRHKLSNDIVKMILFDKDRGKTYQKYIIVCSEDEYRYLTGDSYLAAMVKEFKIHVKPYYLDEKQQKELEDVMWKQDLRNQK